MGKSSKEHLVVNLYDSEEMFVELKETLSRLGVRTVKPEIVSVERE